MQVSTYGVVFGSQMCTLRIDLHVPCADFLPDGETLICPCCKEGVDLERQRLREAADASNMLIERMLAEPPEKRLAERPKKRSGKKTKVQRIRKKALVKTTRPQHRLPRSFSPEYSSSSSSSCSLSNQKPRAVRRSSDKDSNDELSDTEELCDINTAGNTSIYKRRCCDQFSAMSDKAPTKWLKLMAIGSKKPELQNIYEGGTFSKLKGRQVRARYSLSAKDYQEEIYRRSHFLDIDNDSGAAKKAIFTESKGKRPSPKNWTTTELKNWLEAEHHYINTEEDEAFLVSQLEVVKRGMIEVDVPVDPAERRMAKWTASNKWSLTQQCRLVDALLDESLRDEYLKRNAALTRQQLDARGTDAAGDTYWDKVALKFNDANWKPISIIITGDDWGPLWRESHDLFPVHEKLVPITADQVKQSSSSGVKVLRTSEHDGTCPEMEPTNVT